VKKKGCKQPNDTYIAPKSTTKESLEPVQGDQETRPDDFLWLSSMPRVPFSTQTLLINKAKAKAWTPKAKACRP